LDRCAIAKGEKGEFKKKREGSEPKRLSPFIFKGREKKGRGKRGKKKGGRGNVVRSFSLR